MLPTPNVLTATIADEGSLSDAVECGQGEIVGFGVPTIVSAALTFEGSHDGVTFRDLYDLDGTTETVIAATTGARFFDAPAACRSVAFLKVRSGIKGAEVTQTSGPIAIEVVVK